MTIFKMQRDDRENKRKNDRRTKFLQRHRAHTAADWKLDDICGGAGRLDALVRSDPHPLKSHGIRRNTDVWLSLRGNHL